MKDPVDAKPARVEGSPWPGRPRGRIRQTAAALDDVRKSDLAKRAIGTRIAPDQIWQNFFYNAQFV
jgi:hypothetical protein